MTARKAESKTAKKSGYELKTKATGVSVDAFLDAIPDERRRNDARAVLKMMQDITGELPRMWGPSIVGFGKYHYRYASGQEGDMCIAGFSPRSTALTVYLVPGFQRSADLMGRLGKFTTGKSCLYVKRLDDVDSGVLRQLIEKSIAECRSMYPDPS
jgi:hypothetical protein